MKIKYEIFDEAGYRGECAMIEDLYPNTSLPDIKEYTEEGSGEVLGYIKGGLFSEDKFLIADDKSGEFKKIKVRDCKVLKD